MRVIAIKQLVIDLEQYLDGLKKNGVDVSQALAYLESVIVHHPERQEEFSEDASFEHP